MKLTALVAALLVATTAHAEVRFSKDPRQNEPRTLDGQSHSYKPSPLYNVPNQLIRYAPIVNIETMSKMETGVTQRQVCGVTTVPIQKNVPIVEGRYVHPADAALGAVVGAIVGALISIPPYMADSKWVTAQKTMNLEMLKKALSPDYFNPSNSIKFQSAVRLLENSNLPEEAILFARRGVVFNPNELDAWKMLYYATNSSLMERARAKAELIRLDPLNTAWKELP